MSAHRGIPTTAELVAAVSGFLRDEVMTATDGRLRFNARVAANVLSIVEAELERGHDLDQTHRAELAEIGFADDAELSDAIRDGRLPVSRQLIALLRRQTTARLSISNPRHLRDDDRSASMHRQGQMP
jgi:uncharacterized protein DUF6285